MTVNQIVKQFGYDNCPMTVKQSYDNGSGHQNYHTVCWLVEANENNDPNKLNNKKMPFTSTYWVEDSNEEECLAVTGFEEWPVPLYRKRNGSLRNRPWLERLARRQNVTTNGT